MPESTDDIMQGNKMRGSKVAYLFFALSLMFALQVPTAQIGEVAGHLAFSVQVGHTQSLQLTVLNEGGSSIGFSVIVPTQLQVTSGPNSIIGQTQPTVTAFPLNGTIPSRGSVAINVTVFMPLNDTPGQASWEGIIQVLQSSNLTNPGGAVLQEGVAKIFSAAAIPSTTTTTSTTSSSSVPQGPVAATSGGLLVPIIIVIIVVAIVAYYVKSRKPAATRRAPGRAPAAAARRRGRPQSKRHPGRPPGRRPRGRPPAKRRPGRPPARRRKRA